MGVLALNVVRAVVPVAILLYIFTLFQAVEKLMGWPSEVLLLMCVVTLVPLMLFAYIGAKTGLIGKDHKLVARHFLLVNI